MVTAKTVVTDEISYSLKMRIVTIIYANIDY